jgi:hypothetical protein
MKSRFRMLLSAITLIAGLALLFAALALPLQLAAQDKQDNNQDPNAFYDGFCQVDWTNHLTGNCITFRGYCGSHSFAGCYRGWKALKPGAFCYGRVDLARRCR